MVFRAHRIRFDTALPTAKQPRTNADDIFLDIGIRYLAPNVEAHRENNVRKSVALPKILLQSINHTHTRLALKRVNLHACSTADFVAIRKGTR